MAPTPLFGRVPASGAGRRPKRRLVVLALVAGLLAVPAASAVNRVRAAGVTASVNGTKAVLGNERVRREWRVAGGVVTTAMVDVATGRSWAGPASNEFSLTLNGLPLTSTGTWEVLEASAHAAGTDAQQVVFRLGTPLTSALGAGIEVDRTYTLHAGSA